MNARRGAFSIVELLVVVVIVVLLFAQILWMLGDARGAARDAASLVNMRQHGVVFGAYASDHDDHCPYLFRERVPPFPARFCCAPVDVGYFKMAEDWTIAMVHLSYVPGPALGNRAFVHPDEPEWGQGGRLTSYYFSSTLYSRREYWNPLTRTGPEQWGPVRVGEVAFPSQKAGLTEIKPGAPEPTAGLVEAGGSSVAFLLIDGAALRAPMQRVRPPYRQGEGSVVTDDGRPHFFFPFGVAGMHTIDGFAGRDIK